MLCCPQFLELGELARMNSVAELEEIHGFDAKGLYLLPGVLRELAIHLPAPS
jgi:hypothetical protein